MHALRSLRRSRALTLFDIARLTGIPVRVLAEAECGLHSLSRAQRVEVAFVFGLRDLPSPAPTPAPTLLPQPARQALVAAALATALATAAARPAADLMRGAESVTRIAAAAIGGLRPALPAPPESRRAAAAAPATATSSPTATATATATATSSPTATATATASPTATATATATPPAFLLTGRGPLGCPLLPAEGLVIMTQGYAVGTHVPAEAMGAIDLAISGGETFGRVVVATHAGVARTQPDTWPAGNHVWVMDEASGWRTGYAHLSAFLVADGQFVEAGTPIGLVGSTGYSTGPHLHYHVWHYDTNLDPTDLALACFR